MEMMFQTRPFEKIMLQCGDMFKNMEKQQNKETSFCFLIFIYYIKY